MRFDPSHRCRSQMLTAAKKARNLAQLPGCSANPGASGLLSALLVLAVGLRLCTPRAGAGFAAHRSANQLDFILAKKLFVQLDLPDYQRQPAGLQLPISSDFETARKLSRSRQQLRLRLPTI